MKSSLAVAAAVLLPSALAGAAPVKHIDYVPVSREQVWAEPLDADADLVSRTIYLNRCEGGCTITFSNNDSAGANTSAILGVGQANFTEFQYSDAEWDQFVQCVRETYAPFNVKIVTERPTSGIYWMNIAAGTSAQGNFGDGVLGVSPATFDCPSPLLNDTITFTFINDPYMDHDVNEWCWVAAQETAHSFGLDHEALDNDPMTYRGLGQLPTPRHDFQDVDAPCGAFDAGDDGCYCPSVPTQNSYQSILGIFGAKCADDSECADLGDGYVCAAGDCIAGPDLQGGLGADCADATECESGTCTQSANDGNHCTVACDPNGTDCPAGFECLDNGSQGVCWPTGGGGGGCCSTSGDTPTSAIGLGFAVALLLMRRPRTRRQ